MKLVMLDRDGVLNEERDGYVKHPGELIMIEGAGEAVAPLNRGRASRRRIVSNQSAVGRGIISAEMLERIHDKLREELGAQAGADRLASHVYGRAGFAQRAAQARAGHVARGVGAFSRGRARSRDDRRSGDGFDGPRWPRA